MADEKLILTFIVVAFGCAGLIKNKEKQYDYEIEERIISLRIERTVPPPPVAHYVNFVHSGNLVIYGGKRTGFPRKEETT